MALKSLEKQSAMIYLVDYCLNYMRNRTIDEQLKDFSAIMKTSMKLQISYGKTDLEVRYEIGPHTASVRGFDESEIVHQCKQEILHVIRVFCSFTNDPNKRFHRRISADDEFEHGNSNLARDDVYSEMRLLKNKKYNDDISEATVLINPEVDRLKLTAMARTTSESRSPDSATGPVESPLLLKITYSKTELKVTYEIERYSATVVGVAESTCLRQCRLDILDKFNETRRNANAIDPLEAGDGPISSEANISTSNDRVQCPKPSGDSHAMSAVSPKTAETKPLKKIDNKTERIVNDSSDRVTETKVGEQTRGNSTDGGPALPAVRNAKVSVKVTDVDTSAMTPRASYQAAGINIWGKCIFDSNENFMSVKKNGSSSSDDKTRGPSNDIKARSSNVHKEPQVVVQSPRTLDLSTVPSTSFRPMELPGCTRQFTRSTEPIKNLMSVKKNGSSSSDDKTPEPGKHCNDIKARGSNVQKEPQVVVQSPRTLDLSTVPSTSYRPMETVPGTTRSTEPIKKSAIKNVADIMDKLQPGSISANAETLLDILVEANGSFVRIMDMIVQKAIDKPEKSDLFAKLCSDAHWWSHGDLRDDNRRTFSDDFNDELINACERVLNAERFRNQKAFYTDAYVRTLGVCKFMGELFLRKSFLIVNLIMSTAIKFIKARDAHSMECLCVLLETMGPTFEKINTTSRTQMSPQQVYWELEKYAHARFDRRFLPDRTLFMVNELLQERYDWLNHRPPPTEGTFTFADTDRMQLLYRQHRNNINNNRPACGFTFWRLPHDVRSSTRRSGRTQYPKHRY